MLTLCAKSFPLNMCFKGKPLHGIQEASVNRLRCDYSSSREEEVQSWNCDLPRPWPLVLLSQWTLQRSQKELMRLQVGDINHSAVCGSDNSHEIVRDLFSCKKFL